MDACTTRCQCLCRLLRVAWSEGVFEARSAEMVGTFACAVCFCLLMYRSPQASGSRSLKSMPYVAMQARQRWTEGRGCPKGTGTCHYSPLLLQSQSATCEGDLLPSLRSSLVERAAQPPGHEDAKTATSS